jgi:hypothetical protein
LEGEIHIKNTIPGTSSSFSRVSFSCPFFGLFDKEREDRKKRRKKL